MVEVASPGAHYTPQNGIEEEIFNLSGLFGTRPDRYHSEDLVEGQTLGTPFRFAEVHAEERRTSTDSKGRTQTHWVDISEDSSLWPISGALSREIPPSIATVGSNFASDFPE